LCDATVEWYGRVFDHDQHALPIAFWQMGPHLGDTVLAGHGKWVV
jgi:hypothetical protein